jgi:hypothetical protein
LKKKKKKKKKKKNNDLESISKSPVPANACARRVKNDNKTSPGACCAKTPRMRAGSTSGRKKFAILRSNFGKQWFFVLPFFKIFKIAAFFFLF